jgi:hypothetical protein
MEIQKQNSNITAARKSSLRRILESEDPSRELAKFTATLSQRKIFMARLHYIDLEDELNVLRRQWRWWSSEWSVGGQTTETTDEESFSAKATKDKALEDIQKRAEKIKETLEVAEKPLYLQELKQLNDDDLIADISTLIIELDESFNLNNDLNTSQIEQLACGIPDRWPIITLEDIALCFNMAKMGRFGDIYRLDVVTVYSFLTKYMSQVRALISDYHQNQHILGKAGSVSYNPANKQQVYWALRDRDINPMEEDYYRFHKEDYVKQKPVKEQAKQNRIEKKLRKSANAKASAGKKS